MVNRLRLTPVLCAAIGAGLGFYFPGSMIPAVIITVMFIALALICFFRVLTSLDTESRQLKLMALYSVFFAVGLCIGFSSQIASAKIVKFGIPENNIIALNGVLLEDPRIISGGRAMAVMSLRQAAGNGGVRASSSGEVTVFFPEYSALMLREFGRGTVIFTEGNLRSSETGWTFSAQSIHVVEKAPAIERMRTGVRLNLIQRFEGKVWGGLALAMLVGIRDNLDTNFTAMYRSAGLSYILALSGMHLAVLAALITFLLKKPLGLKAAAIAGAVIIILYCFIVGPMPSLNRAALMYLLGVLAILGALPKESLSVLALSFLIQIIVTPAAGNTISFILSYLAMLGILIVAKALVSIFSGKVPDFLLQPLAISCGAFLATAGVCSYTFGYIAPAGIIAALVIVPATTVFMIGSIIWIVLDMVSFSGILNLPLSLLYQLMEKTAFLAGNIPGILGSRPFVLALSIVLSLLIVFLELKSRKTRLHLQPFL
jgi:competence protein ComEC